MKTLLLIGKCLLLCGSLSAQNVGINADGAAPDGSALLDINGSALPVADQKGLLIPRVQLTATNVAAPVVAPATSLLVYNMLPLGSAPYAVTPGFYYWDGTFWRRLDGGGGPSNEWLSFTTNGF